MRYRITDIERIAKIYHVEADNEDDAREKHENGESEPISEYPLEGDTEIVPDIEEGEV